MLFDLVDNKVDGIEKVEHLAKVILWDVDDKR